MINKKLIEVSLPLDVINDASAYDKMPGIGAHPKGIHHWWARLPLPSARAILFASLVDDPSAHRDRFPTEEVQEKERDRLFDIIRRLCQKKMHTKPEVFKEAFAEIQTYFDGIIPTVHDPFAGGGSIPLEGLRLGLDVFSSDLNPIPVLINKAMLEIIPKYWNNGPLNKKARIERSNISWSKVAGFCNDILYYGDIVLTNATKELKQYYPNYKTVNKEEYKIVSWLWSRTVKCPNPVCGCNMPLIRSFQLSNKDKSKVYAEPIIKRNGPKNEIIGYEMKQGTATMKKTVSRSGAVCVCCNEAVKLDYVRSEGRANRIGFQLFGVVAEGNRRKIYLPPVKEYEEIAFAVPDSWSPEYLLPEKHRNFQTPAYGMKTVGSLFTKRQLYALNTFVSKIADVKNTILGDGGTEEYANDILFFLGLAIDRCADFNNLLTRWSSSNEKTMNLFGRQAIPMIWDFGEANILENFVGGWKTCLEYIVECVGVIPMPIFQISFTRGQEKH